MKRIVQRFINPTVLIISVLSVLRFHHFRRGQFAFSPGGFER